MGPHSGALRRTCGGAPRGKVDPSPPPSETVDKAEWKTGNGKPGTGNWAILTQKGRFSIFGFRFPVFHSPSGGLLRRKSTLPSRAV